MEYSPENAIPYVGRVDAGTIEAIRRRGVEVVSSGDLVQRFVARWSDQALATHLEASDALYRVKDRAFEAIAARLRRRPADDRARRPAADDGLVRGRGPDHRRAAARRQHGERRQSALRAAGDGQPHDFVRTSWCCSICGANASSPARSTPISRGSASPAPACRRSSPRRSRPLPRPATRRSALVQRAAREQTGICAGWQVDRAARDGARESRLWRTRPAPDRAQPGDGSPRQRRPHGRLRNPRRPARAAGHRLHDRARRVFRSFWRAHRNQRLRRHRTRRG